MSLIFTCPNCDADIIVRYLKPGQEALCRLCGIRVIVPAGAKETDAVPDHTTFTRPPPQAGEPLRYLDLERVLARRRMQSVLVSVAATATVFVSLLAGRLGVGGVLLLGGVGCVCAGAATYVTVGRSLRLRDRKFREAAAVMGLEYLAALMEPEDDAFGRLPLFRKRTGRAMVHVLKGPGEWVFDYEYKLGYRRPKKSHTVAVFHLPDARLPGFRLHREVYGDRIETALGFQDIDFADDLKFSGQFRLRSKKEDLARQVFSASLRGEISTFPGLSFEGDDKWLAIYTRIRCKIEDIESFVRDTQNLACAFAEASRRSR